MISSLGNVLKTAAVASALFAATSANATVITLVTPSGASGVDGPVSAKAVFDFSAGHLSLTISNLLDNPTSVGQLISDMTFSLSGATGSGLLTTVNSGLVTTISSGGSYTAGAADALTRWHATEVGTSVHLTTLTGGQPDRLIIGPDSAGGFDPSLGSYSNANSSIVVHEPTVLGSATFEISIPGITEESDLTGVSFSFGTAEGELIIPGVPPEGGPTIPEPTVASLFGMGALALGMARRRRA
jgi:hypothetical protein